MPTCLFSASSRQQVAQFLEEHSAVSWVFNGSTEPLEVINWKEFYDMIEEAIDACEDVGITLERIVLKNG